MKVNSKKPKKQRKALYNYKLHQKSKLVSCKLADFLTDEYGIKRLPLRVGDNVRVTKGEFRDFEGEVIEISKDIKAKIKECVFDKADGTQFHPKIHVSNLIITKFSREGKRMDGWRASMIERKAGFIADQTLIAPKKIKKEEEIK